MGFHVFKHIKVLEISTPIHSHKNNIITQSIPFKVLLSEGELVVGTERCRPKFGKLVSPRFGGEEDVVVF